MARVTHLLKITEGVRLDCMTHAEGGGQESSWVEANVGGEVLEELVEFLRGKCSPAAGEDWGLGLRWVQSDV